MKSADVKRTAFAMPLTNPAYPPPPYRFYDREYIIIKYRTDRAALEAVVPEPLEIVDDTVSYEFIRMPDSTGFGDYTETGQVIPVRFNGETGGYVHSMYLNDNSPIAGGRELHCGAFPDIVSGITDAAPDLFGAARDGILQFHGLFLHGMPCLAGAVMNLMPGFGELLARFIRWKAGFGRPGTHHSSPESG